MLYPPGVDARPGRGASGPCATWREQIGLVLLPSLVDQSKKKLLPILVDKCKKKDIRGRNMGVLA